MSTVTKESFVKFVYPFLFDVADFQPLVRSVNEASWVKEGKPCLIWKRSSFSKEDLLPHVSTFLNAAGCENPSSAMPGEATAYMWTMQRASLDSIYWVLGAQADWLIELAKDKKIQFDWCSVELSLFMLGTGFLTVEVRPGSNDLNTWMDFIHHFRFTGGNRAPVFERHRNVPADKLHLLPPSQDGVDPNASLKGVIGSIIRKILISASLTQDSGRPWWRDVFVPDQMIPFLCLGIDDPPLGDHEKSLMLYRIRNLFHSGQPLNPCEEDLSPAQGSLLQYARDQWFFFTLDGGGYLAINPPEHKFFREDVPDHVRKQYYLLFLISANQRFTLVSLQKEVASQWLCDSESHRAATFDQIYEHLLEFEARIYFAQVMQRDHHHRCYRKCQDVFQIVQMHQELSGEVARMYERISLERAERMQRKIDLLTFMIGLPALGFAFISAPWESWNVSWLWRLLILVGLIAVGGVLVLLVRTAGGSRHRYRRDVSVSIRQQGQKAQMGI